MRTIDYLYLYNDLLNDKEHLLKERDNAGSKEDIRTEIDLALIGNSERIREVRGIIDQFIGHYFDEPTESIELKMCARFLRIRQNALNCKEYAKEPHERVHYNVFLDQYKSDAIEDFISVFDKKEA